MKKFIKNLFGSGQKPPEDNIAGYLGAIVQWLDKNAKPLKENLNPPTSEAEIVQLESELAIQLSDLVRQAYLEWFTAKLYDGGFVYVPDELSGLVDKDEL